MAQQTSIESVMPSTDEATETTTSATNRNGSRRNSGVQSIDESLSRAHQLVMQSQLDEYEEQQQSRKASLCCFSCCDLRLACIIINSIYMVVAVYALLASRFDFRMFERVAWFQRDEDNDDEVDSGDNGIRFTILGSNDIQFGLAIFFNVVGIIGSILYSKYPVLVVAIWYCVDALLYCIYLNLVGAVWVGLYAYPHFAFFLALRSGQITRQNYLETEKYCCCDSCCGGPAKMKIHNSANTESPLESEDQGGPCSKDGEP